MNTLIAFSNAGILNGEVPVLYGVNLEISRGDFVYIIGKVGTGKTSIIRTLTGENRLGGGEASVCRHQYARKKATQGKHPQKPKTIVSPGLGHRRNRSGANRVADGENARTDQRKHCRQTLEQILTHRGQRAQPFLPLHRENETLVPLKGHPLLHQARRRDW